jgi:hypothetical protein
LAAGVDAVLLERGSMPTIASLLSHKMRRAIGQSEFAEARERVRKILVAAEGRGPLLSDRQRTELEACIDEAAAAAPPS